MALSSSLQDAGDGILAERAADGDARAFEVLVRRHTPYMRAFAIRLTGSRADADDVSYPRRFAVQLPVIEAGADLVGSSMHEIGDDERTRAVVERMLADGTAWTSGSRWRDRAVLRISVSNAGTTDDDVARSIEALRRAAT